MGWEIGEYGAAIGNQYSPHYWCFRPHHFGKWASSTLSVRSFDTLTHFAQEGCTIQSSAQTSCRISANSTVRQASSPSSSTILFTRLRASISQGWDCGRARGCGDDACDTCRYSCCSRSCCSLMLRFRRSLRRPLRQARMAPRETSTTANIAPVSIPTLP